MSYHLLFSTRSRIIMSFTVLYKFPFSAGQFVNKFLLVRIVADLLRREAGDYRLLVLCFYYFRKEVGGHIRQHIRNKFHLLPLTHIIKYLVGINPHTYFCFHCLLLSKYIPHNSQFSHIRVRSFRYPRMPWQ